MRFRYSMLVIAGIVAVLALPMAAQMVPARPNDVRTQLSQPAPGRPAGLSSQTPAPGAGAAPAAPAAPRPAGATATVPRRDPFDPLLGRPSAQGGAAVPERLPPGKAGLMIGTLRIDGLVRGPNGMIAVVTNPQQRVYFLREGDRVFDGQVVRITMEAVSFRQTGRDAMGASQEREVIRRLYPIPGEQR